MKVVKLFAVLTLLMIVVKVYSHSEQLVEISVEIAEVNNDKAKELGIKWIDEIKTGEISEGDNATTRDPALLPVIPANSSLPSLIRVGDWYRYTPLTADLRLLVEKGAGKIMSKPKLLAKNGTTAKFLVGGEIPIVSPGVSGGSIQWKQFGIMLKVKPTILPDNQIELELDSEVSRLDWANAVAGNPALDTRTVSSEVQLKSGETITIAGLVETQKETSKSGIPLLMDIPVLGYLFSNTSTKDVESTVMIFATPRIIR